MQDAAQGDDRHAACAAQVVEKCAGDQGGDGDPARQPPDQRSHEIHDAAGGPGFGQQCPDQHEHGKGHQNGHRRQPVHFDQHQLNRKQARLCDQQRGDRQCADDGEKRGFQQGENDDDDNDGGQQIHLCAWVAVRTIEICWTGRAHDLPIEDRKTRNSNIEIRNKSEIRMSK